MPWTWLRDGVVDVRRVQVKSRLKRGVSICTARVQLCAVPIQARQLDRTYAGLTRPTPHRPHPPHAYAVTRTPVHLGYFSDYCLDCEGSFLIDKAAG